MTTPDPSPRPKGKPRGVHAVAPNSVWLIGFSDDQRRQVLALVKAIRETNRRNAVTR